jgi:hypothetical protein
MPRPFTTVNDRAAGGSHARPRRSFPDISEWHPIRARLEASIEAANQLFLLTTCATARICRGWPDLCVTLCGNRRLGSGPRARIAGGRLSAWAIPTNEELMIARHTRRIREQG